MLDIRPTGGMWWVSACALIAVWLLIVGFVNPVGNFMVNDDWAFMRAFETFKTEGRMASTGWGPQHAGGGPSLIAQLVWALPFSFIAGTSPTVLRISVLTIAVLGLIALMSLLARLSGRPWISLFGAVTVMLNPLFLSQSFTFMTDVPFVSFMVLSLLCLFAGMERRSTGLIAVGLLMSLCAVLTRQAGLVLPAAFAAAAVISPWGRTVGRLRMVLLAIGLCVIPWLSYELFLALSGSTPVTEHQVIHKIFLDPVSKGFLGYLGTLVERFGVAVAYTCFFVSPVLLLVYDRTTPPAGIRYLLRISLILFCLLEVLLLTRVIHLPVAFYQNVIFDFGIGPVLLKDTYILRLARMWTMPPPVFYALAYWAFLSVLMMVGLLVDYARVSSTEQERTDEKARSCFAAFCLIAIWLYLSAILFTGFHDRYLIPLIVLSIIFLLARPAALSSSDIPKRRFLPSVALLIIIGSFSLLGVRDFMSMKRALVEAHNYLIHEVGANPCNVDGGFEFNGNFCYRKDFRAKDGLSWWWVDREDYLTTLGPLDGYEVVRVFPFRRLIGPDGAVNVLKPVARR
jgi:4-amino-4-deoxy-L-arabinose transferase-like glycosyltransferase